jgi:hypothetical protein
LVIAVIFHLKKMWDGKDLWQEIKSGRKTSEWREASDYWIRRLSSVPLKRFVELANGDKSSELRFVPKVKTAWFVVGYPEYSIPRLEAEIHRVILHKDTQQLEIQFANVKEITKDSISSML